MNYLILILMFGLTLNKLAFCRSRVKKIHRNELRESIQFENPSSDSDGDLDLERRILGLSQILHGSENTYRERSSSRNQFMKLVKKIILRHSCVKMNSKKIMNTLREGRVMNHENKREMRGIRKSLDRKAMLCRLRRVKFAPDDHRQNPQKLPPNPSSGKLEYLTVPPEINNSTGTTATNEIPTRRINRNQNKQNRRGASDSSSANESSRTRCNHGDIKWGQVKLNRMKTRMKNLRCWNKTARKTYSFLIETSDSDGSLSHHAKRQKCRFMREYNHCINTRLIE